MGIFLVEDFRQAPGKETAAFIFRLRIDMQKAKIMIAGADVADRDRIGRILESLGYELVAAVHPEDGFETLAVRLMPDLFILDAGTDNLMTRRLMTDKIETALGIPVIRLKGDKTESDSVAADSVLPMGCLIKPVKPSELKIAIDFSLHAAELKRKQEETESALKESRELSRVVLENILDPVFITDDEGNFTFICSNVHQILGYKMGEILERVNIKRLVRYPDLTPEVFNFSEPIENLESIIEDKNGDERIFLTNIKKVSIKSGTTLFTFHDVTDIKHAENKADLNELYFRMVFEQAPVGIAIIDSNTGRFVKVNQKYSHIVGYSEEEMLNLTFQEITFSEDVPSGRKNLDKLLSGEIGHYQMEKRYVRKNDEIVWVNLIAVPLWLTKPVDPVHLAIAEDITQRKSITRDLESSHQKIKDTNTALNVLLKKKEEYRKEFEENLLAKINQLILPKLKHLKNSITDGNLKSQLEMLESGLQYVISTFYLPFSSELAKLTPAEVQVITLIKSGISTNEIAHKLNLSKKTVETHRKNIRKKLGLTNKKQNLETYLIDFELPG